MCSLKSTIQKSPNNCAQAEKYQHICSGICQPSQISSFTATERKTTATLNHFPHLKQAELRSNQVILTYFLRGDERISDKCREKKCAAIFSLIKSPAAAVQMVISSPPRRGHICFLSGGCWKCFALVSARS